MSNDNVISGAKHWPTTQVKTRESLSIWMARYGTVMTLATLLYISAYQLFV